MSSQPPSGTRRGASHGTISRRRLLAVGGAVGAGALAGCLNRVASAVTNTGASPAAVFAGARMERSLGALGEPHVSRLTPTLSGRVELEGWVTSAPLLAQDYNSSRSNKAPTRWRDDDADGDGLPDADEFDALVAYLGGEATVGERFTMCLPDASVPGGNGSIAAAVTPERLIDYLTGQTDAGERVYSWGTPQAGPGDPDGAGDCDDDDTDIHPGAVCGTTPHFVAEVTGPTATGGGLAVIRSEDEVFVVRSSEESSQMDIEILMTLTADPIIAPPDDSGGGSNGPESSTEAIYQAWTGSSNGGETGSTIASGFVVAQVLVQPPGCPSPFPGLLFVARGRSDDQLVYTGGWVIDDAALYQDAETVLSLSRLPQVVGVDVGDLDGDGLSDGIARSLSGEQGAQVVAGTVDELVEDGLLSDSGGNDLLLRKRPTRERSAVTLAHVSLDAPVLHLLSGQGASQDVKFKAGAELSKAVN